MAVGDLASVAEMKFKLSFHAHGLTYNSLGGWSFSMTISMSPWSFFRLIECIFAEFQTNAEFATKTTFFQIFKKKSNKSRSQRINSSNFWKKKTEKFWKLFQRPRCWKTLSSWFKWQPPSLECGMLLNKLRD